MSGGELPGGLLRPPSGVAYADLPPGRYMLGTLPMTLRETLVIPPNGYLYCEGTFLVLEIRPVLADAQGGSW